MDKGVWSVEERSIDDAGLVSIGPAFQKLWFAHGRQTETDPVGATVAVERIDLQRMSLAGVDPGLRFEESGHVLADAWSELCIHQQVIGPLADLLLLRLVWVTSGRPWRPTEAEVTRQAAAAIHARCSSAEIEAVGVVCPIGPLLMSTVRELGMLQVSTAVWFVRMVRWNSMT